MITIEFDHIDLGRIASSGQCFRWIPLGDQKYAIPVHGTVYEAEQIDEHAVRFTGGRSDEQTRETMRRYFDGETDYDAVLRAISPEDAYLLAAAESEHGIRILRQPLWETVASFIVSQNNNIPRIRTILARLCAGADAPFPTAAQVARFTVDQLRALGLGYRADYLVGTALRFADTGEEETLRSMEYGGARERLMSCPGVGPKVADCICLYGLGLKEAFPMDVWVKRILAQHYPKGFAQIDSPYAGIYQQYMFAYERRQTAG